MNHPGIWWRFLLVTALAGCVDVDSARRTAQDTAPQAGLPAAADNTAPHRTACDLLTAAEIDSVTHLGLRAGVVANDYAGDSQCKFDNADGTRGGVMAALHEQGDIAHYRRVPGSSAVSGLGDAAVWNPATAQIAVQRGAAVLSVSFLNPPARRDWAVSLGRRAAAKLDQK